MHNLLIFFYCLYIIIAAVCSVACIINIVGDLILVAGLHPDAAGAALATVFAQAVSVVCAVILLIKKKLPFKICRSDFRLNDQCGKFFSFFLKESVISSSCLTTEHTMAFRLSSITYLL